MSRLELICMLADLFHLTEMADIFDLQMNLCDVSTETLQNVLKILHESPCVSPPPKLVRANSAPF